MKKGMLLVLALVSVAAATSCTVYVDNPPASRVYNSPAPDFYTMRVYDNRYVFYTAGDPVATWIFNGNGTVFKEGIIINGPVRVYYDNGNLFSEAYYSNGIRDGVFKQYYPDGTLMLDGFYSTGFRHGLWRSYARGRGGIYGSFEFNAHGY